MSRDRAAYMREYRAKKRRDLTERAAATVVALAQESPTGSVAYAELLGESMRQADEIAELVAEVARLKREVTAKFPHPYGNSPWVPEFRPVPKPGQRK